MRRYSPHLLQTLGNLAVTSSSPSVAPITRAVANTLAPTAPLHDPSDRMDGEEPDTWTLPSELPGWIPNPTLPGFGGEPPGGDYIPPGGVEDRPQLPPGGGIPPGLPRYTQTDLDAAYERGRASERDNLVKTVALSALVSGVVGIALGAAADRIGF